MSDHYVCFIPTTPTFVPTEQSQAAAVALLQRAWPRAQAITPDTAEHILFRDCGENFEAIRCPHCSIELEIEPWQELMDRDYSEEYGFRLDAVSMPCCGKPATLAELVYEWPQGFSRFALRVDGLEGQVPDELLIGLEAVIGSRLRVIHQMY